MATLRRLLITGLLTGMAHSPAMSAENWGLCRIPAYQFISGDQFTSATEVEADQLSRSEQDVLRFYGRVILQKDTRLVEAEEIHFNDRTEQLRADGDVILTTQDMRLSADELAFDQINERGELLNPDFQLKDRHGNGSATKIEILDASRSRFDEILYTTCDTDDRDWYLTGETLEINDESGVGTALHTTLYFQDIPVFYFPWFQFPIDDRRMSGVLTPTLSISDADNSHLAVPIYWNIAPSFDTTFTPAWYSERGYLYASEHRYLTSNNHGQVDLMYIDDDVDKSNRWFKKWQHGNRYTAGSISSSLLLQEVSDDEFFGDFDRVAPGTDEINHLDRHFRISHAGESWHSSLLWQNYQTVDPAIAISNRPYQRLPRLSINSQFSPMQNGIQFNVQNELVRFKRESSINGNRTHLTPTLSWTSNDSWYFFKPQIQYALTDYTLDNNPDGDSIQRSIPITSLDTGLFFERIMGPDNRWLQTLEPRLYFVNVPFEDQSDIPDFDTAIRPQSYNNFFRDNRFSGSDRIGDTRQATFGLGTRIYDNDSGDQLFYARMAQIYYQKDRKVSLNGIVDDRKQSSIIGQVFVNPTRFLTIAGELVYDDEADDTPEKDMSIHWARNGAAINLEYHLIEDELEQAIFSFVYPVSESWTLVGKYHQSLLFDKPVENLVGLGYESCCWGLKILASQVSDDDFDETDQAVFFELTLKGLTQAGKDIDSRLGRVIPGYRARF